MFKNLRDRLKGVSKKLEDELEAELEEQLEKELADEMAKQGGDDMAESAGVSADEPEESTKQPEPHEPSRGTAAPDVDAEPAAPEPAADEAGRRPSDDAAASEEEAGGAREAERAPEEEGPQEQGRGDESVGHGPKQTPPSEAQTRSAGSAPQEPRPEAPEEATPSDPAPSPAKADPAPSPAREEARPRVTGRKELTAEEIEARLRSELEEAVETQREVESVVRESGGTVSRFTINEDVLEDILWELEVGLLESDVALPVIEAIKDNVKEQLLSMSVAGRSADQVVEKVLRTAIRRVLNVGSFDFDGFVKQRLDEGKKPVVVMFVGVNGTGKTTSIARIAHRLKGIGISSVMAAGDTFRAGAIEQLVTHGDRLGVRVVKHSAGADPAAVAYDAIEHAKARRKDVVLLDTAGRMQTNTNLMDEMDKIRRVADPDLVVFVGDSLAGNDAVEQARRFDEVVDINGAILTKVDVDAKGGAALSVAYTINKPLLFVGVGQDYDDIRPFDADWMVDRLFGGEAAEAAA